MALRDLHDDEPSPVSVAAEEAVDAVFDRADDAAGEGIARAVVIRNRRARARRRLVDAVASRGVPDVPGALREELAALVDRWRARQWDDAFAEAEAFELRCAESREVLVARAVRDEAEALAAAERLHRQRVLEAFGRIEIRGLQASARVYQRLDAVWVPLHVHDPARAEEPLDPALPDVLRVAAKLALQMAREPVEEALARHARAVVEGGPGSGKSTLVAHLAAQDAAGDTAVPVVIAVRSLPKLDLDLDTIAAASGCDRALLARALDDGRARVLIDGLDEATGGRDALAPALVAFAAAHPNARVLATTRPGAGPTAVEGFATLRLLPMTREETFAFVDRWALAAERSLQKGGARAEDDARAAADDLKGRVRRSRAIARLAETPLLCSVLCVVHRFRGQRIPERRVGLYEACADVLLFEWDQAKLRDAAIGAPTLMGTLDAQAKRALLGALARDLHDRHAAEAGEGDVVRVFRAKLPELGVAEAEAPRLVEEIRDRSGMLVERAPGAFGFSHLGFQEYLAAYEYVRAGACDQLVARHGDPWWHEVIALAAGFTGAPTAAMVRALLDADGDGVVGTGTMLAAWCEETAVELPVSLRKEIEARVATVVPPKTPEATAALRAAGDLAIPVVHRAMAKGTTAERAVTLVSLSVALPERAAEWGEPYLSDPNMVNVSELPEGFGRGVAGPPIPTAVFAMVCLMLSDASPQTLSAMLTDSVREISDEVFMYLCLAHTMANVVLSGGLGDVSENLRVFAERVLKRLDDLDPTVLQSILSRGQEAFTRFASALKTPAPLR